MATKYQPGHYPVWNQTTVSDVAVEKELTFESDMRVSVTNETTDWFGPLSTKVIGEFAVPVPSIMSRSPDQKPQLFNLLNEEGRFVGQILANFYLKEFIRDPKTRKIKDWKDDRIGKVRDEFEAILRHRYTVNIELALFGVRALAKHAVKPRVTVRLTNDHEGAQTKVIKLSDEWDEGEEPPPTRNPNVGKIVRFEKVALPWEPLCWPYIEVQIDDEVTDKAFLGMAFEGCEECFTTIALIEHAGEDLLSNRERTYAEAQLRRGQDRLALVQN